VQEKRRKKSVWEGVKLFLGADFAPLSFLCTKMSPPELWSRKMAFACVVRPRVQVLWKGASRRVTIPFVTFTAIRGGWLGFWEEGEFGGRSRLFFSPSFFGLALVVVLVVGRDHESCASSFS